MDPITFAYADPPYMGLSQRLYGKHRDYAGEVDHAELITRLCDEYPDGWALSLSMKSLPVVARLCPTDVLTLSWVKPIAPPMGDMRHYSWEPVILRGGRRPQRHVKSHLVLSPPQFTFRPTPEEHVIGEKPEGFCHWVFEAAGLLPQDTLVDLFPGSGAVERAWKTYADGPATAIWHACVTCSSPPHERCVSLKTGRPCAMHAARAGVAVRADRAIAPVECTCRRRGDSFGCPVHGGDEVDLLERGFTYADIIEGGSLEVQA